MKDIEKRLDEVLDRFTKLQEGDAHAANSGLIALAYGIAHLGDKLEKAAKLYAEASVEPVVGDVVITPKSEKKEKKK